MVQLGRSFRNEGPKYIVVSASTSVSYCFDDEELDVQLTRHRARRVDVRIYTQTDTYTFSK